MTLQKVTYIIVIIASVMAIAWLGKENSKPFTYECDRAKEMADKNLEYAYKYPGDPNNTPYVRAEAFASYYEAFCD